MDSIFYLGIFVALVGLAGGVWSAVAHSRARARLRAAGRWPVATGRVVDVDVQLKSGGGGRSHQAYYVPAIRYLYSAGGREREGRTIRFGVPATSRRGAAEAMLAPYPVGATPAVRYNPENPDESVLELGKPAGNSLGGAIICAMILAVGLLIVFLAVRGTFSADTEGRWHAHFEIEGFTYEGELEVHRQMLEREVARGEHTGKPGGLLVEVDEALDVADRPAQQVLGVVDLPLAPGVAVALEVLREALEVAGGDHRGERLELDPRAGELRLGRGRPAARRGGAGHSATTSYVCRCSSRSSLIASWSSGGMRSCDVLWSAERM